MTTWLMVVVVVPLATVCTRIIAIAVAVSIAMAAIVVVMVTAGARAGAAHAVVVAVIVLVAALLAVVVVAVVMLPPTLGLFALPLVIASASMRWLLLSFALPVSESGAVPEAGLAQCIVVVVVVVLVVDIRRSLRRLGWRERERSLERLPAALCTRAGGAAAIGAESRSRSGLRRWRQRRE